MSNHKKQNIKTQVIEMFKENEIEYVKKNLEYTKYQLEYINSQYNRKRN